jgi:hypothetical protein
LRVAKRFTFGSARVQGMLDLHNLFNSNNVLRMNGAYGTGGAAWARPQATVPGRLLKPGAQLSF